MTIYETEGNITPLPRPPRKNNSDGSSSTPSSTRMMKRENFSLVTGSLKQTRNTDLLELSNLKENSPEIKRRRADSEANFTEVRGFYCTAGFFHCGHTFSLLVSSITLSLFLYFTYFNERSPHIFNQSQAANMLLLLCSHHSIEGTVTRSRSNSLVDYVQGPEAGRRSRSNSVVGR